MEFNVYVTREIPKPGLDVLKENCRIVEMNTEDRVLKKEELVEKVRDRDGILCLLTDKIDSDVIKSANKAKVFANYAVGYDNIDVKTATDAGIIVTNTPGVLTDTTADLAWALLFSVARRTVEADKFIREGKFVGWAPMLFLGKDITKSTLGIIGAGRIGTAFALKSRGFDMKILYCDENKNDLLESRLGAEKVSLGRLLEESDFVSVHVPLSKETHHLIGGRELKLMKKTAYLINTSRGPVVDEKALVDALREKQIAGAALDVYENEPALTDGITELNNVVLVPHIASASVETRSKMAVMAAKNLVSALKSEKPENIVNPEVLNKLKN